MNKVKVNILIVEDEPLIAGDIAGLLESVNFSVAGIAHNGNDALMKIEALKPDAVLLDINLGSSPDGVEVAHIINYRWNLPFVFLTSHADRNTIERVKQTFPAGYLLKPFDENDLLTSLEIALFNHISRKPQLRTFTLESLNHTLPNALTEREFEIIQLIRQGKTNQQIADTVFLSVNTIKTHLLHIFEKMDVKNRTELLFRLSGV